MPVQDEPSPTNAQAANPVVADSGPPDSGPANWHRALSKYEKPERRKATRQLLNTLVPYFGLWAAMVYLVRTHVPFWFVVPLMVVAAGFLVRVFIFFHDCCHGSFFESRAANRIMGYICGTLTFTPFEGWQHPHSRHHATSGDLDRRGLGDIWTLTVEEYLAAPWWKRGAYRVFRNPCFFLVVGPAVMFLITHRFPRKGSGVRERRSVALVNLALLTIVAVASRTIGLKVYFLIQIPTMIMAGTAGVWLFYVQHQFESAYWAGRGDWDPERAALAGSSYYKLPRLLQWFTGNIGLHHIHHLRPRIPNYNLQLCQDSLLPLQSVPPLTLWQSLKSVRLKLWDEREQRLVGFGVLKQRARE